MMLDFIYYPISAVLLAGHVFFGFAVGQDNGLGWLLAVLFTAFLVRLCLLPLSWVQDTALSKASSNQEADPPRFPTLPYTSSTIVQVAAFVGLWHVLSSFNRVGTGSGQLRMTPYANAHTPNYLFNVDEVQSFLRARLFGAPISMATVTHRSNLATFADYGGIPHTAAATLIAVPLILAVAALTAMNGWSSPTRYFARRKSQPAMVLYPICQWLLPVLVLITGLFLPIGMLVYLLGNNLFTMAERRLWARHLPAPTPLVKADAAEPIGYTEDGHAVYPVVGYTAEGTPVTTDQFTSGAAIYNPHTNAFAITSLILGLLSGPIAIPFGHIARSQIRRTGEQGAGMALAGLIFGYAYLAVFVIFLIAGAVLLHNGN